MPRWELAQVNIATPATPLTSPEVSWFMDAVEPVNAVADTAPGFLWRLQTDEGDSTALRAFNDDSIMINLSVWKSVEALANFVYHDPAHQAVLRQRRRSFPRLAEAHQALWWVPSSHRPSISEAEDRLSLLRECGPTAQAFTFREPFPAPDNQRPVTSNSDWFCRA